MILGGHGITAWGATSDECEAQLAGDHPDRAGVPRRARPRRAVRPGRRRLRAAARRGAAGPGRRAGPGASAAWPRTDRPQVGHYTDSRRGARLPGPGRAPAAGRARHLLPGPLPAHQGPPAGARPAADRAARRGGRPAARAARRLPRGLPRLLRAARRRRTRPPMRGADPAIVLVPGVGMFCFGARQADRPGRRRVLRQRDQRDARRRGGLDVRADRRGGEVPHRVLGAGGGQAAPDAQAEAAGRPGSRWSPAPAPASAGRSPHRLAAEGACVVVADRDADAAGRGRRRARRRRRGGRR